jgi:spermidine synthase
MFKFGSLETVSSPFNSKIVVENSLAWGISLKVDGLAQSGGVVEAIWKSTLRKIYRSQFTVHKALILGLGGGTVAKLVKKYWPDAKVTGVEIDPLMIELGTRYLALGTSKTKVVIDDAYEFIKKNREIFDLVIVDLYFGDEFPKKFEEDKFLKKLTKTKLVIFNRLYFGEKRKEAVKFGNKLEKIFDKVEWFYPQANLVFICSKPNTPR